MRLAELRMGEGDAYRMFVGFYIVKLMKSGLNFYAFSLTLTQT